MGLRQFAAEMFFLSRPRIIDRSIPLLIQEIHGPMLQPLTFTAWQTATLAQHRWSIQPSVGEAASDIFSLHITQFTYVYVSV